MKLIVPIYAAGPVAHALFDANVGAALIERYAQGFVFEFMAPADREAFERVARKLGVPVVETHPPKG
jgi:hypothetical protein